MAFGAISWTIEHWPPTSSVVGWLLTAFLAAVAVGFLGYGIRRVGAVDRPAVATLDGISGPRISHLPWSAIIRADVRRIGLTWNVVVVVAPGHLDALIESPNPLVRAYQRLFTATWSPDERQLPWIPRPRASTHRVAAFVNAELARR
jgi:hypothetical protein